MAAVQSVQRTFAILRTLAVGPAGITEVAIKTDLPKSTVARLLAALEAEDAVKKVAEGSQYALASGLTELAGATASAPGLAAAARPHLRELADELGEAVGIAIRTGRDVYYVDQADGHEDVMVRDWTGEYAPMHLVPSGLVYLAHLDQSELDAYLAIELEATVPKSVTDPELLRERLVQVRSAGYAWVFEEFATDINSVAAPVLAEGELLAALHVHGPAYRFPSPDRMHDVGLRVIESANRLAAQLG